LNYNDHNYVEEQNRKTSVAARIYKPQQMATANSGFKRASVTIDKLYNTTNSENLKSNMAIFQTGYWSFVDKQVAIFEVFAISRIHATIVG
jgi:hypothetical protein